MKPTIVLVRPHRPESLRCITRVVTHAPKKTRGWNVRVFRSGRKISKLFSDAKYGGRAGALSEAMHFRDEAEKQLPLPERRSNAGVMSKRNTSGMVGVCRGVANVRRGGRVHTYLVWTASAVFAGGRRKVRHFYVNKNHTEEEARAAAIAQRQRWEDQTCRRRPLSVERGTPGLALPAIAIPPHLPLL